MSGILATVGQATGSGLVSQLAGLLQVASFRGIVFEVFDATDEGGRRWVEFLFPHRRETVQEDMGAVDGPVTVNAVLIGDDYVRRAQRLKAACQAAGPAMLRHPWLGPIKVVLAEKPRFVWDHQKQRVCTVQLTFRIWSEPKPAAASTLTQLLDAVDQAIDDARTMLADALAPLGLALGLISMATSALQTIGGVIGAALATAPAGPAGPAGLFSGGLQGAQPDAVPGGAAAIAAAAASPLDAMTGGVALVDGITSQAGVGDQVALLVAAVLVAIADAGDPGTETVLGPGPAAQPLPPSDPRAASALLLALPALLATSVGAPAPVAVIHLVARAQAAVTAARAASLITWASRDEALAWRAAVDAALGAAQVEVAAAANSPAAGTLVVRPGALWLAVRGVRAAWSADVQEIAGRLPAVRHVTTLVPMSAWLIAQAVAGDTPAAVRPAMLDLVARNRVRHPGRVPAGRLEILVA